MSPYFNTFIYTACLFGPLFQNLYTVTLNKPIHSVDSEDGNSVDSDDGNSVDSEDWNSVDSEDGKSVDSEDGNSDEWSPCPPGLIPMEVFWVL